MNVRSKIIAALKEIIKGLTGEKIIPQLEHPVDEGHGDYASNIALVIFKDKGLRINDKFKTPMEFAKAIAEKLNTSSLIPNPCSRVETVPPGFINFWISKKYLIGQLSLMLNKNPLRQGFPPSPEVTEGHSAGCRIMVEFTDPNPFKEFHIGHLYSNTVGEAISRLLEANGAVVKRANYQGDIGMHVAKVLYGIQNSKFEIQSLKEKSLKERIKILGEAYALGAKVYEENEKAKREIEELNKKIYSKDEAIMRIYEKGRQWSLEYFETIYKRLGTQFDFYYFESEVGIDGLKLVKEYLKKGVFEESQGAIIFPGGEYGLHNRVFINSLGLPTYEAKELGLALRKYRDFDYDQSIIITGNEIIGYFKVLIAALSKINPDLAAKTKHLPHGMVRLPTGKMSSRTGNIVTGEWLLDEAKKLLRGKYSEMNEETLEKVAVGSVKYALLKSSIGHNIEFNFEESINLQGNSGPYLQYTYARTHSVLAKLKIENARFAESRREKLKIKNQNSKFKNEETSLLRSIYRFPEIVGEAGEGFAPNLLCNYLFDLAQKFNLFYQKRRILGEIGDVRDFRFLLTATVGQILKNGLSLLGISAPQKM